MTSSAHFRITYDGPALAGNEMDVRDLAPALLALGDLCDAAGLALYGRDTRTSVNVRASFKTGCFGIDLAITQNLVNHLIDWMAGREATALANATAMLSALGVMGGGLIGLVKWLKGRRIKQVEPLGDKARILTEDDDMLEVEMTVITLYRDIATRENLARALAPIEQDGITQAAFGDDTQISQIIERSDMPWFRPPMAEDVLLYDQVREQAFSIISLAFKEDNKWRLYDGAATIHAAIEDMDFLVRVDQNLEVFAKGDVLICQVRVRQWQTPSGAKTEYTVEKVLNHRQAARQIPLPLT